MQTDRKLFNAWGLDAEAVELSRGLGVADAEGRTHVEPRELLRMEAVRQVYFAVRRYEATEAAEAR